MLSNSLDFVPQENFYRIAARPLYERRFPGTSFLWGLTIASGFMLLFGLMVRNHGFGGEYAPVHKVFSSALAALLMLLLLSVVFSVKALRSKYPRLAASAELLGMECTRVVMWANVTLMVLESLYSEYISAAATVSAVVLFLSGVLGNIFMFARLIEGVKSGRYRAESKDFWDRKDAAKIAGRVCGIVMAIPMAAVLLRLIESVGDIFDWFYVDLESASEILVMVFAAVLFLITGLFMAYWYANRSIVSYCYVRFRDSIEKFAPQDCSIEDEEDCEEEWESDTIE